MKHRKLLIAIIALIVAASPILVQGAERAMSAKLAHSGHSDSDENETGCAHLDHESATGAAHEENNKTGSCQDDDHDDQTGTQGNNCEQDDHDVNDTKVDSSTVAAKTCAEDSDNDDNSTATGDTHEMHEVNDTDVEHVHPIAHVDDNKTEVHLSENETLACSELMLNVGAGIGMQPLGASTGDVRGVCGPF